MLNPPLSLPIGEIEDEPNNLEGEGQKMSFPVKNDNIWTK